MAKKKNKLKNINKKLKSYQWIIILLISIALAMWVYGMAGHYFPDPLHIGFGQYVDIATGITIFGLLLVAIIITIVFKKNKREIGMGEYTRIRSENKKK